MGRKEVSEQLRVWQIIINFDDIVILLKIYHCTQSYYVMAKYYNTTSSHASKKSKIDGQKEQNNNTRNSSVVPKHTKHKKRFNLVGGQKGSEQEPHVGISIRATLNLCRLSVDTIL